MTSLNSERASYLAKSLIILARNRAQSVLISDLLFWGQMEPLTILGAIAAVAQLSKVIHSVGSGVVTLFYHNREIPEKVRRLKSTIQSLKAKLEVLATSFEDLTDKSWLSRDLWDNFNMSLEQVNSDIEAMATIIKNYDTETRKIIRFRKRIRYHISDQRALSKCVQHLESSVKNLQCMENSIHMYVINPNCKTTR